jgi:hypothetical protein
VRRSRGIAFRGEGSTDLRKAGEHRDQPDARNRSPGERAGKDALDGGKRLREEVPVPETGPRCDDQDQPRLQEIRGEQQTCCERDD